MAALELLAGERQSKESGRAVIACNDYLRLGPGRSLSKLVQKGARAHWKELSESTLKKWSARFGWQERAAQYDAAWELVKDEERRRVMDYGLALDFERVERLKALADFLEGQLYEQGQDGAFHNVWLPDVKQIGSGEYAQQVDIERFNAPLISEFRAVLDDIAKEVGGRVKKTELGNPKDDDGHPVPLQFTVIEVIKDHHPSD